MFAAPILFVGIGIAFFQNAHEGISRGIWLAMLWTSMTFAMLYYGQHRLQTVIDQLDDVIPDSPSAQESKNELCRKIYARFNDQRYYVVSLFVALIVMPILYITFISNYSSWLVQAWCWIFFMYIAFVGGYGMVCGIAFNSIVREIVEKAPFELNPNHPDQFMGLRPLGSLSVANAITASSSALLFPLIFETIHEANSAPFLSYLIFSIIMFGILAAFAGPLYSVKNKIEKEKFSALISHEAEYQHRMEKFKEFPGEYDKAILKMMLRQKNELKTIRLFPFESRMIFQVVVSILLPIVMLVIEIQLKQ